ncbi:MAG: ABC transporter substrate-binding protein [Deltaproteobacteria bacterium]|nr:MAG: ABC transporter substrate-binding protein [Deltaproteobacteria bacterium]
MIKNFFISLLSLFLLLFPEIAYPGGEVVVVQGLRVAPYEEALQGFKSVCKAKITRLILTEMEGKEVLGKIKALRPELILAIGMSGLLRVKSIKKIPIIYLMTLNPQSMLSEDDHITGIDMNIPQERQLQLLREALPEVKTAGLLYDPEETTYFVQRAQKAALKEGIKLIVREVHNSQEVPSEIKKLKGKIDVFWMLPDITVCSPEVIEFFLLFFLENNIPTLTFAKKYVEIGALMSIETDPFDMGKQAGEMASEVLAGKPVKDIPVVEARKEKVTINLRIVRKLGIEVNEKFIEKVKVIK